MTVQSTYFLVPLFLWAVSTTLLALNEMPWSPTSATHWLLTTLTTQYFGPLHQAAVFSKLYQCNAYHRVHIREGDEWKTVLNTPLCHFENQVMPFGLNNTPAVFQALVNHVLCDMLNRFVFVHLDDILIFSQIQEQHFQCAHLILQRLLENKLYVKVDKCRFHSPSVDFLRFVIERGQVKMDPTKVKYGVRIMPKL